MGRRRKKDYISELAALIFMVWVTFYFASGKVPGLAGPFSMLAGLILLAVFVGLGAVGIYLLIRLAIWFMSREAKSAPPPLPSSVRLVLRDSGNLSPFEIGEHLDALDWFQLEKLTAALFEAKGSWVETRGGAKADGGIDLVVSFNGATAAVQCKHWGKWHCGPAVVRELVGAMVIEKIPRGFLVCRSATDAAEELAARSKVTIVQREGLISRIVEALDANNGQVRNALLRPQKVCPKCGAKMILRTASKGPNADGEFWGCSTYPKCRQTMKV